MQMTVIGRYEGDRAMSTALQCSVLAAGLWLVSSLAHAVAQEPSPEAIPADALKSGYRLQEGDDLALPLQPVKPRSAAIEARNDALSWYMTGRLLDSSHRNEPRKALTAYRKAVKLDPEAIEIYRNLVPLEFALNNLEEAVRLAAKAVQLDPDDYEVLQLLARQAATSGELPEAIKYLEQAVKSPRVGKETPEFILLNKSLGLLYSATGQKEKAADCYEILFDAVKTPDKYNLDSRIKNSLLADPTTSYERMGQILADANRLKLALEAFELAGKSSRAGAGNLAFNRARVLMLSERYDEALDELQKYFDSQRTSKGRESYQLLADILQKLKRSDELIGRLEKLAENDGQNVPLQYFLADRLADVNELDRARTIYDAMLQSGGDATGYAGLARVLRKLQKSDELLEALGRGFARGEDAIAMLEPEIEALSEDKALVGMLFEAGRTRAKANRLKFEEAYLLAHLAATLKEADASAEFYRSAISLNRNGGRPGVLIQMEMAEMLMKLHKYSAAVDTFKEILGAGRLNEVGQSRTNSSLAQALEYDNRTEEALAAIGEAIRLDGENPVFRFYEAWIYSHARRWDEAVAKFEQVLKEYPDEKQVVQLSQFTLSNIYVQKGELRKGEEILEKVLEVNPDNAQANNDLGYLWADQGKNLERAEKMIRKALVSDAENGAYLDSLGWVLFKLGKFDEALPPLEQATRKSIGGDGTVWDHLGDALLRAMQTGRAIDAWQTALQHLEDERSSDLQLSERIKEKLKQHGAETKPKPADKNSP
jgi:tetratricopeptide (TPR) repeat protein